MKKIYVFIVVAAVLFYTQSCGVGSKAQLDALAKSSYDIESVDHITIANLPLENLIENGKIRTSALSVLGLAFMKKDIPVQASLNLKISNPTVKSTKINQFKYLIEVRGKQLFEGTVDSNVHLQPNASTIVPMSFQTNVFEISEGKGLNQILEELIGSDKSLPLTLKIKPSVRIGSKNIFYPGYISINKELSKSMLLR